MLEKYYRYKLKYRNYIILIKVGIFYECFDKDALIINKLFNYKMKRINNTFKVGFPTNNIDNIEKILIQSNLFYIIVQDNDIIKIYNSGNNNYEKYKFDIENILYNFIRTEKIMKFLEENMNNIEIEDKLKMIESIIE